MKKRALLKMIMISAIIVGMLSTVPVWAADPQGLIRGGVLRVAVASDASTYDANRTTTGRTHVHAAAVFNGLVRTDPLKEEVSLENIIPDLAERWEITPDGKTYTFYLRRNVKFHDGKPFTAKDVKYSLDKFRNPKKSAFSANVAPITNIEIVNDHTLKIHLKHPYTDLLIFLCPPYASIYPEHLKDVPAKSTDFLVGTGPFKFKSKVPGKVSVYEKNPDYFIKGLPYLDGYEVYSLKFPAAVDAFIGGRLDCGPSLRSYLDSDRALVLKVRKYAPEAVIGLEPSGAARGIFSSFSRKGPWNDIRVRKALAMVIDSREVSIASYGGLETKPVVGAGLFPLYQKGAWTKEEVARAYGKDKPKAARISAAKKLMAEAGYANGFSMECIVRARESFRKNAMLYCADVWKKTLNINLTVTPLERAIFFPRRDKGDFDICNDVASTTTGCSAIEFLATFLSGQARNYGQWSNKEYDEVFEKLSREQDPNKKVELARQAQAIFYKEMPMIVLEGASYGTAWRPDLMTGSRKTVVMQPVYTNFVSVDRIWFAGTAKRWMK
ncbi:ABC transporter substrate-binding protein [Thermodesulfobacteriota bacterium]